MIIILLKDILKEQRISQKELSTSTGICTADVSRLCNNRCKRLNLDHLSSICDYLKLDVGDLLVKEII